MFNTHEFLKHSSTRHPKANGLKGYDLEMVEMREAVDFSDPKYSHIRPVCLPTKVAPTGAKVSE